MPGSSRWRLRVDRGTTRPAFQLILYCRSRQRFSLFPCLGSSLPSTKGENRLNEPMNYLTRRGHIRIGKYPGEAPRREGPRYECYLWPDRLRWHFFFWGILLGMEVLYRLYEPEIPASASSDILWSLLAAIIMVPLLMWILHRVSRARWLPARVRTVLAGNSALLSRWSFMIALLAGTSTFFFILRQFPDWDVCTSHLAIGCIWHVMPGAAVWGFLVLGLPWLVYGFTARPVLVELRSRWPLALSDWLTRLLAWHPEDIGEWTRRQLRAAPKYFRARKSAKSNKKEANRPMRRLFGSRLDLYLPAFFPIGDAIDWSPGGCPRRSLLQIAIADLFSDDHQHKDPWQSPALRRWLWYWCAPVWGSYLTIVLIIAMVDIGWLPGKEEYTADLSALMIAWLLYAIAFMRVEAARLNRWGTIDADVLGQLPPLLRHHIKSLAHIAPSLESIKGLGVFTLINTAAMLVVMRWIKGF